MAYVGEQVADFGRAFGPASRQEISRRDYRQQIVTARGEFDAGDYSAMKLF
jgi:hypothetical protein